MARDELSWTDMDDRALRAALTGASVEPDGLRLADPADVRAAGDRLRHRRLGMWVAGLAAATLVVAGVGAAVAIGPDDRPPLVATAPPTGTTTSATPTPTPSASPSPPSPSPSSSASPSARPTPTPTPSRRPSPPGTPIVTDTRVIGADGSIGPFRIGMTTKEVQAAIRAAGLTGKVSVRSEPLGGTPREVLVQNGVDTGYGSLGLIGAFDAGRLDVLFARADATIRGAGVGDPITAFQKRFPGKVKPVPDVPHLFVLTLTNGVRLQLGSAVAVNDPNAVRNITVLPPGTRLFLEFS